MRKAGQSVISHPVIAMPLLLNNQTIAVLTAGIDNNILAQTTTNKIKVGQKGLVDGVAHADATGTDGGLQARKFLVHILETTWIGGHFGAFHAPVR